MKTKTLCFVILAIFTFNNCKDIAVPSNSVNIQGIYVDFDAVAKVKKQIQQKDPNFLPAYTALIDKAEVALSEGPFSVMDKKRVPPSGDKHDYLSMGPYWWPDPYKADGLPYIRRDGEVNPETRGENVDTDAKSKMFNNVEALGWAYYFSDEKRYAEKAVELIETWFINPESKMNPNLNFAQGIPGRVEGRGIGIIDFSSMYKLISTIQILEANNVFPQQSLEQLNAWLKEYFDWLHTSDYGKNEDDQRNNHGTWFDVQAVGIALYLGKTDMAKERVENVKNKRITRQIELDGSQPLELARTRSLSYSAMNLRGFIHLANMSQTVGVDLWDYETSDGRGIKKALDFLLPYVHGNKDWEHQQIISLEEAIESAKLNYLVAAVKTGNKRYFELAKSIKRPATGLDILLYPLFESNDLVRMN
jgi:hypothetical protein